jgi:sensor histidine kinase regulating citrate/malate metabolism
MLKASAALIIAMLFEAVIMVFINLMVYASDTIHDIKVILPYINVLVIIITIIVLISIQEIGKTVKKNIEVQAMKDNLKQTESLLNTLHTQRHEYNRHLQSLQAMIHLDKIDDAIKYIDGLSENNMYSDEIIYFVNPIITAILNSKSKVAETKNIMFDFAIKCDISEIPISPWDLSSVLGNLLDNAFEAVMLNEEKNRSVGLEVKKVEGEYVIYVFNNGPIIPSRDVKKIFDAGYTTKGSQGRGYGLFLVKNIIKQYGGKLQLITNNRTLFKVCFTGKEE